MDVHWAVSVRGMRGNDPPEMERTADLWRTGTGLDHHNKPLSWFHNSTRDTYNIQMFLG